ncbi:hypothetical protein LTR28_003094, partial [Elasticomyces elasticus]
MPAGVVTSTPYDTISRDTKTPIPVGFLPKDDRPASRREPLPHHLNKGGGDYRQYPAIDAPAQANGHTQSGPPRPPPHGSSYLNGTTDPYARSESLKSTLNGSYSNTYTSFGTDSSNNTRASSDQGSIHSTHSQGRSSSFFSNQNHPQTSFPPVSLDSQNLLPTLAAPSSRQSHNHGLLNVHNPSAFSSTASFSPEGFILHRPADDRMIEKEFLELMLKRGWKSLPEQARRQMEAYPISKKWTLVHQDRLSEWQGEQKRRMNARSTIGGADG